MIIIQQDQFSIETLQVLEKEVLQSYKTHFDTDKLTVIWNLVDYAVTNRNRSQSSLITIEVPNGTEQTLREALLFDCFNRWKSITNQNSDHIMVSALDSDVFNKLIKSNLGRLNLLGKTRFLSKTLMRFIQSKYRHNLLISSFN